MIFCGDRQAVPSYLVSVVTAFRMIKEGCQAYLAHVMESAKAEMKINDIPVVCEFLDVFPDELPGLPMQHPNSDTTNSSILAKVPLHVTKHNLPNRP